MTDDIVTQLRFEYASCECSGIRHDCDRCETDKQAADEIERLREAGDALAQGIRTGQWDDALDAWTELRGE
jgi:demethoxyubiquinone hydroxylase (CLK1/Coq7/Cat5 family)